MLHLIKSVVPIIAVEWEDVAYALDYDIHVVDYIKRRHHEVEKCCRELMKDWLTTNNGAKPKLWSTLLAKVGEVDKLTTKTKQIIKDLETAETPQSSADLSPSHLKIKYFSLGRWVPIMFYCFFNVVCFRPRDVSFKQDCNP